MGFIQSLRVKQGSSPRGSSASSYQFNSRWRRCDGLRAVALAVAFEELCDATNGLAQIVLVRQEHNAEMVRLLPVEAGALHQHDAGFLEQLQEELPVVGNRIDLGVQLGEHVQRRTGLDTADAGNGG